MVIENTQKRIEELLNKRQSDLAEIARLSAAARTDLDAAKDEQKTAAEHLDVSLYESASDNIRRLENVLSMYNTRAEQIRKAELVTAEESETTINNILAFEDTLTADFKKSVLDPVKKLRKILEAYTRNTKEAESTISSWTANIHKNYNTFGITYKKDKNGVLTDRSETPVPVHRVPFVGCPEAVELTKMLERMEELFK